MNNKDKEFPKGNLKSTNYQEGMFNSINGVKFYDDGFHQTSNHSYLGENLKELNDDIDALYRCLQNKTDMTELQENIIVNINCLYIDAMRRELNHGSPVSQYLEKFEALEKKMKLVADETGNEFIKLQTGMISILLAYANSDS